LGTLLPRRSIAFLGLIFLAGAIWIVSSVVSVLDGPSSGELAFSIGILIFALIAIVSGVLRIGGRSGVIGTGRGLDRLLAVAQVAAGLGVVVIVLTGGFS
jgi:hypothetical protein